jgi:repressor LexA
MTPRPLRPQVLQKIRSFHIRNGRMPSYSELCGLFDYASKNAARKLAGRLMKEGHLAKDDKGRLLPRFGLPLAGHVMAGFPSPAEEELVDVMSLDQYLIRRPEASFLLKVSGDSMIEAGILPGDLVIIERGKTPKSGDIVLAQIDRQWTLKYYKKEGRTVSLVAGNPKYPVLYPKEELVVAGVVGAQVRRYK